MGPLTTKIQAEHPDETKNTGWYGISRLLQVRFSHTIGDCGLVARPKWNKFIHGLGGSGGGIIGGTYISTGDLVPHTP